MNFLFSVEGEAALQRLSERRALYAFDFDGTLAPIVALPDDARTAPGVLRPLAALREFAPVAILTGRSVADLGARLGFTPDYLIGNHGAEGLPQSQGGDAANRAACDRWRAQLHDAIAAQGLDSGIFIEDKTYSLSVHYRLARDRDAAEQAISAVLAALDPPPRLIGGKCVFNLLPDGAPDKGQALAALVAAERCDAAFYIGDDETDETVFYGAPDNWLTVRVGYSDASGARFFLHHQGEVAACVQRLVKLLQITGDSERGRRTATP